MKWTMMNHRQIRRRRRRRRHYRQWLVWVVPQAFLNGFDHDACVVRSTSDPPPRPSSTATSSRPSSGNDPALDPWLLFPSTPIATKVQVDNVEEGDGENKEENGEDFS